MALYGFVIDIEADGFIFQSTKIWTIVCTDLEDSSKRLVLNPFKDSQAYDKLYEFASGYQNPNIVFHYGLGYDIFVLMNLLGCEHTVGPDTLMGMPVQFIDSYYLSMFLNPDRLGHSIEYFGEVLGLPKIDWRGKAVELGLIEPNAPNGAEFQQHHPEMDIYCIRDTDVNKKAFEYLLREWEVVYNSNFEPTQAFKCGQKSFYLMSCQELAGWKFDQKLAAELEVKIAAMMEEIRAEVEPKLPPRALKKSEEKEYTFPAKPFKKDGSISATLEKFIAKHSGTILPDNQVVLYGKTYEVEAGKLLDVQLPMEMANQDQMKDWFLEQGWAPTMWNYKRGEDGKPLRDPITRELTKTTPKMQEAGKICENLMAMEGDIVKQVVKWLSLRNRQSVLKGWMSNERLAMDGRIGASRSGIAACFTGDTTILTDNGMRNWFQIEVGDFVVTHKDRLRKVTDKFENGVKEVFLVTLENGITTKVTANHPFYLSSGEFVKLEDMSVGDEVMAYPEQEKWKQWNDTELLVSSWGRVKNLRTGGEYTSHKALKHPSLVVDVRFKKFRRTVRVGRLVLDTFCGVGSSSHCLHDNDMPYDNNIYNLRIGSDVENGKDRARYQSLITSARSRENTKLTWEDVEQIRASSGTCESIANMFGISPSYVSQLRNFHRWKKPTEQYQEKKLSIVPIKVVSIVSLGELMTYGISVDEDESHLTDGIMTHNTHRQRHSTVVNVPKASDKVLLGKEFRSLWIAEDGFLIAAADAAALEGRVQGHYTWKYDGGSTARELLDGDIHSKNVVAFYGNVHEYVASMYASPDFNKEDPIWKPHRDKSKNGFYCLPMHTKVLTKQGWKQYGEIVEGEELLSFNEETGVVESDVVLRKHLFHTKEVLSYGNKWDKFECTEDHRWYGWRRSKTKGKPSKKVFGYFHANEITQEHNIILTAPWVGNETSNLTDAECALLGWITSDGYLKWSEKSEQTSCAGGKRKAVIVNISQADSKYWRELEQVLDDVGAVYVKDRKEVPNGNTINTYRLSSKWSRPFLDRVLPGRLDKHEIDWVKVVLSMTRSNLIAFYDAFYLGDGNMLGNQEIIGQNKGNICDAVITAAQLIGNGRVSVKDRNDCPSPMSSIRVQKRKHITCQELSVTSKGVQDTFCLTTRNGSFIIWQDDFIGITGNCIMYGGGAPKVASTLGISQEHGMAALEAFWEANPGTKQLRDDLEVYWNKAGRKKYLKAIDGRQLCTRKKSALLNTVFQSCGGIAMDYALCKMDQWLGKIYWEDRKPYYLYKGYKVRRIGYFHK